MKFNARLTPYKRVGNSVNVMGRSIDVSVEAFNYFEAEKKVQSMYPGYRIAYMHTDRSNVSFVDSDRREGARASAQEGGAALGFVIGSLIAYLLRNHPRVSAVLFVVLILFIAVSKRAPPVENVSSGVPKTMQVLNHKDDAFSVPKGDPSQTGRIFPNLGQFRPSDRKMSDQPTAKRW